MPGGMKRKDTGYGDNSSDEEWHDARPPADKKPGYARYLEGRLSTTRGNTPRHRANRAARDAFNDLTADEPGPSGAGGDGGVNPLAGGGSGGGGGGGGGVQPVPANHHPKWDNQQWQSEKTTVHFSRYTWCVESCR